MRADQGVNPDYARARANLLGLWDHLEALGARVQRRLARRSAGQLNAMAAEARERLRVLTSPETDDRRTP